MRKLMILAALMSLSTVCSAEWLSGDLKNLNNEDDYRSGSSFQASCVADNGEYFVRPQAGNNTINVYTDVATFFSGGSQARTVTLNNLHSYANFCFANGRILANLNNGQVGSFDPMSGGNPTSTALINGTAGPGWGGGAVSFLSCDGNYVYNHHNTTLSVYELDLSPVATHSIENLSPNGGGFAAGGYYYLVDYSAPTMTVRWKGSDGAQSSVSNRPNNPTTYMTHFSFDYFDNNLMHSGGNPGVWLYTAVLDGPPSSGGAAVPGASSWAIGVTVLLLGALMTVRVGRS